MRELILLCTKNVHFMFNGETFTQVDSIAMGSLLPPILAGIFMLELERNLIPILKSDSHVPENFCQIKKFPSLVQKNIIICLFGV